MRIRTVLAVSIAAVVTAAGLLAPAASAATGPAIDNASMMNGGVPCSTSTPAIVGFSADNLEVLGSDSARSADSQYHYNFALWPQANPATVTTFTATTFSITDLARGRVPYGTLVSGTSYAWRVQLADTNGTSPWSQTCLFSYDYTPPQPPTVTSGNFPNGMTPGPVGQLAQFTFNGNGDPDTAGFQWIWGDDLPALTCSYSGPQGQLICPDPLTGPGLIRADAPGGTASLTVAPPHDGPIDITVAAVDRAGNVSQHVSYWMFVPYSGPTVTGTSSQPSCGASTATVSFAPYPGVTGVLSYTYTLDSMNGSRSVTVPADQSGQATATIDLSSQPYDISATSLSASGFGSSPGYASLDVNPVPTVSADIYQNSGQPVGRPGVLGNFTFSPPFDGHVVTGYRYHFLHGPTRTIAADQNSGTATVQYRPTGSGTDTLTVQSLNGDAPGGSCQLNYTFVVGSRTR